MDTRLGGFEERALLPGGSILLKGKDREQFAEFYDYATKRHTLFYSTDLIEHPELVAERIIRFGRLVGPENVVASTDCGLGGRTHPQVAWAKLRSLCEGAALATHALGGS
jgi:methionine synthase II (cobalamin-independent)